MSTNIAVISQHCQHDGVLFFLQIGVLFSKEMLAYIGYLIAKLATFWCTLQSVVYQH